jgi:uncharacterized membrane protein YdbT with pleckstrin-like domain
MDQGQVETSVYHKLGGKALFVYIVDHTLPALGFLFLAAVIALFEPLFNMTLSSYASVPITTLSSIDSAVSSLALACVGLFLVCFCVGFLIAWLKYLNYRYILDDTALEIQQGILFKETVSIPYRQIQNVDIKRSVLYRIFGLSSVFILTAGREDINSGDGSNDSEGIIPIIDKDHAESLREILLGRTHVQEVRHVEEPGGPTISIPPNTL